MPWQPSDARRHTKKASSPKSQRQWSHVADSALSRGASEGSAIRQANAVIARRRYDEGGTVPTLSWADRLHLIQNRMAHTPQNMPRVVVPQDPGVQDPQELSESDALDNIKRLMDQRVQTMGHAAGGSISPLASIVGNPLQMRASLPKLGGGVGLARMRMPHIPLADTMHNIDQRMAGARVKLPKLQAAVGGRAKRKRSAHPRKGRV